MFPVPDLDALTLAQLLDIETVFGRLACVAGYKAEEKKAADRGDPQQAAGFKRCWEHQYGKLPAWARYADPKDSTESS